MMLAECALVIQLDVIIEVQKGSDWVICTSENQYQTSAPEFRGTKRFFKKFEFLLSPLFLFVDRQGLTSATQKRTIHNILYIWCHVVLSYWTP